MLFAVATTGCSDETDEEVERRADAGADADESSSAEIPSVDSIDPDGAEPSDRRQIIVESADTAGVISENPPLPAADFLSDDEAERLVSGTDFDVDSIAGQDRSGAHNSIRYAPADADEERFGVGLQIWDLEQLDQTADERLSELRDQFLSTRDAETGDLPGGAFTSRRAGIRNLVFVGESGRQLFVLSCDTDHCRNYSTMTELAAEIAEKNLDPDR